MTTRGPRDVQDLSPGDFLLTRDGGVSALLRIERHSLVARAIYVIGGSIGHSRPDRDTMLPAGQCVLLRDWRASAFGSSHEVLIEADRLVDGEYVRDIGLQAMTVYRLYCARPRVLHADGMELGSADSAPGPLRRG